MQQSYREKSRRSHYVSRRSHYVSQHSPRPNVHISGPGSFKHHQNSTRRSPREGRRKKIVAGEGKKNCEILGNFTLRGRHFPSLPHPSGSPTLQDPTLRLHHPSGPHPSGPHPSNAPPFGAPPFGAHNTLWGPTLWSPTNNWGPTLRGVGSKGSPAHLPLVDWTTVTREPLLGGEGVGGEREVGGGRGVS